LIIMGLVSGRGMEFAFGPTILLYSAFAFCLSLAFYPLRVWALKADMAREAKFREIEAKFRKARLERVAKTRAANSCNSIEGPAS
jgi:hypothetical protein